MKIRTQDASRILHFEQANIAFTKGSYGIYVQGRRTDSGGLVGIYAEEARAKGVLYEMALACERGTKVFYMPQA